MDIKVLKYFVQVAKDQSYTRAAEHLFLSQPALSKLIKKLERELKVPLFRVQKNGVYLTDYGEQFYRRVVPIISAFDSLSAFVETMHSAPVGRLKLGVTPMIASLYVVDIVTNFNRQWPDIELQLIEDGSRALRKMLLDGSLDLALGITGASFPDLQDTVLFKDEMVVIASVGGYKTQGRDVLAAVELIKEVEAFEKAGAIAVVVEAVPAEVAKIIYERSSIPILGTGCGPYSDSPMINFYDLLGFYEKNAKFAKKYADVRGVILNAVGQFVSECHDGTYPAPEHCYKMKAGEEEKLKEILKEQGI